MICLFDDDEIQLNPHEIAWQSRDWDSVKKLIEEYKEKPENNLFKVLGNINFDKKNLSSEHMEGYSKFMIDNMLSRSEDCVPYVYMTNLILQGLPDHVHHDYLVRSIPKAKRFAKGLKLDESFKDRYIIRLLMEYYKVNWNVAMMYRRLLENKGQLQSVLKTAKAIATDEFLKSITKNPKEIKELKLL